MNFNAVAIFCVKESYYRIYFWHMTKCDAIRLTNNSNLNEKK